MCTAASHRFGGVTDASLRSRHGIGGVAILGAFCDFGGAATILTGGHLRYHQRPGRGWCYTMGALSSAIGRDAGSVAAGG
jgi:hypothetical protein